MKQLSNLVLFLSAFFLLTCCRTIKNSKLQSSITSSTDTLIYRNNIKLDTLRIKSDTALLSVPLHIFNDSGINYLERRNGRATIKIHRIQDVIYASANCDSLEKIITSKEREILHLRSLSQNVIKTEISKTTSIPTIPAFMYGFVAGLIALSIFKLFKN